MVLDAKQTTVAYRCPHCGAGVMSAVGLFALSADMIKLKCDCKHSEMEIVYSKDGKVRLSVPCIICPKPHFFTVSSSLFFGKELFCLPCPYSNINICFMGETNHVKAELARTELELLDMLEKSGVDGFDVLHAEKELFSDPQILDIVMFVIKDLDAEGKIHCRCQDEGDYQCEITEDGVKIRCTKCGAERAIPTDNSLSAHAFLNCESLTLK